VHGTLLLVLMRQRVIALCLSTAAACADSARGPEIDAVEPSRVADDISTPIVLTGRFFAQAGTDLSANPPVYVDQRFRLWMAFEGVEVELSDVVYVSRQVLSAEVPPGLPAGSHDLIVRDPNGRRARAALEVIASECAVGGDCAGGDPCAAQPSCELGVCHEGVGLRDDDGDGHGSAACGGDDCDDGNPNCTVDCTDADSDDVCVGHDCDDGTPWCTLDCTDADGDDFCAEHDCDDDNPGAGRNCCVVTTTADPGPGSLRECINAVNADSGTTIHFSIAEPTNQNDGADSWWRISPTSRLPELTASGMRIDGASQRAFAGDTNSRGPEIEIHGALAGATDGVEINASGVRLRHLAVTGFAEHGVQVQLGGDGLIITSCHLGASATGGSGVGNGRAGVYVDSPDCQVGDLHPGRGNLVAYNGGRGVELKAGASGCVVAGNLLHDNNLSPIHSFASDLTIVGNTSRNMTTCCNYDEIVLDGGDDVRIFHNTIYGSTGDGLHLVATNVRLENNIIVGSTHHGILFSGGTFASEQHNLITDAATPPANLLGRVNGGTLSGTDLNVDPLFVDEGAFDLHLTECTSPAINAGIDLGVDQPDLNGAAAGNYNGSAPDLGAFETDCP